MNLDMSIKSVNKVKDYYNQTTQTRNFIKMYEKGYLSYHANLIRLKIVMKRLERLKIKTIFDAGCGSCGEMVKLLKKGYAVEGIDFSEEMIKEGKKFLSKSGFSADIISIGNLEKSSTLPKKKFDSVISLGVFPHIINEKKALRSIHKLLKNRGKIFVQFRNDLFSTFTLNQYSQKFFLDKVIIKKNIPKKILKELNEFYSERFAVTKLDRSAAGKITLDDILSKFHNPLSIESELFKPTKFSVDKIHFYHYHALPPFFQNKYPKLFNELSLKYEKENDWRGYLMSSAFVVEATKNH